MNDMTGGIPVDGAVAANFRLLQDVDVKLTVDIPEFPDTMKPTASRFAFLAIIDLISVASGYRLGPNR